MTYTNITLIGWVVLFIYWFVNAQEVKAAVQKQTQASRYIYLFFLALGFSIIYFPFFGWGLLSYQIIPSNDITGVIGIMVSFSGIAFAIWARKTLGKNWSGEVTLKEGHELIQTGPYRIVRHPIYTGFEIALLGAAITAGQAKGLLGLAIIFLNHYFKTRMEEEIMYSQFPTQYPEYVKRVKRLVPFIF